jgi:hypothetical protein
MIRLIFVVYHQVVLSIWSKFCESMSTCSESHDPLYNVRFFPFSRLPNRRPCMNSQPIHRWLQHDMEEQACHPTAESSNQISPPSPVRRQKRQPNNGKSVSPPPRPHFWSRVVGACGNTSLHRLAAGQRMFIFARCCRGLITHRPYN